jgi:hypothetical protein
VTAILCAFASSREASIWIDSRRPIVVKCWPSRRLQEDYFAEKCDGRKMQTILLPSIGRISIFLSSDISVITPA